MGRDRMGRDRIAYLAHDSYYIDLAHLSSEERKKINFDHPASLETSLMVQHIRQLQHWLPVEVPIYDFSRDTRTSHTTTIAPQPIILLEGILLLSEPTVRELCDIKIFVDADADVRLIRRLKRDIVERGRNFDNVVEQYLRTVRPGHIEFVEPSKQYADIIIREGGYNHVAIEMLSARLKEMLK
jgi:uridine kinase